LRKVMENGLRVNNPESLVEIAQYSRERMKRLPDEYKRFDNPHIYKIGISEKLQTERNRLVDEFKK